MSEDPTKKLPDQSDGKFDELLQIVQAMRTELADLKQTVDARLYDTRPIWEKVQADIAQLQEGQEFLRKDVREVRTELRDINRKLSIFNDNLVQIPSRLSRHL